MGRITQRWPVTRLRVDGTEARRADTLVVEEPLEIRVAGEPFVVTMRTPGHDVELAAGLFVSEGVVTSAEQFRGAIHCGGPGTGPATGTSEPNTYNILDVGLSSDVVLPTPDSARSFYMSSSCGVCGKSGIDAIETASSFPIGTDGPVVAVDDLARLPDRLRARQAVFDKTGGLHAAGLFDARTGELLVVREDVGRHNAVDKVIGWALLDGRLPLRDAVLQVSGRAGFELVQKAVMAGIGLMTAVSAPSSLAVELADRAGLTLVGFMRGESMNVYTHAERISTTDREPAEAGERNAS